MTASRKPQVRRDMTYRKEWETRQGKIPRGHHLHHKLPRRLGGDNSLENLEVLTIPQHAAAHWQLWEKHGDIYDWIAWNLLSNQAVDFASLGGKIGGRKGALRSIEVQRAKGRKLGFAAWDPEELRKMNAKFRGVGIRAALAAMRERGDPIGFQKLSTEKIKEVASRAGRIGGAVQRDGKLGIHGASESERLEYASSGGRAAIKAHPEVYREAGRRNGLKNRGARAYNDGTRNMVYTAKQQEQLSFETLLASNQQFSAGRIKRKAPQIT